MIKYKIQKNILNIALSKYSKYFLVFGIFISIISYTYFANQAVRTLALLEKQKITMQDIEMKVSELESKKFIMENKLDSKMASKMGLVEVKKTDFIVKGENRNVLSINTN